MADCDIDLSVVVSGDALDLNNGVSLVLVEWNTPDAPRRERDVRGPYQAGGALVLSVPDVATITGVVRAQGANWTACVAAANAVRLAFNQFSYTITETVEGVVTTYTKCRPTGIQMVGGIDATKVRRARAEFAFSIDYHPNVPVEA